MNHVKDLLNAGGTAIGTTAGANSEVRFLANAGFDFVLFDTQHSTDDIKGLARAVAATRGAAGSPIIRVGDLRPDQICYALDIGAKGIVVPMVNTPAEAADMVKWCKYPFEGARSSAGMRGEWGEFKSYREYMDAVNEQLLVVPMIETQEALDAIDEILGVAGIDVPSGWPLRPLDQHRRAAGLREPQVPRRPGSHRRRLPAGRGCRRNVLRAAGHLAQAVDGERLSVLYPALGWLGDGRHTQRDRQRSAVGVFPLWRGARSQRAGMAGW